MGEKILVVGGAGYVGSHACLALAEAGYEPVVYDNLSNGHAAYAKWGELIEGDIRDREKLEVVFAEHKPVGVMHFAALIEVGISMREPAAFYLNNVAGAMNLIDVARNAGVKGFVFSSTCAVYGEPQYLPLDEDHPIAPLSPYGQSKAMVEAILQDMMVLQGFPSIRLRYFNAAGADPEGRIGERHDPETHAIPLAIQAALGRRKGFSIMGDDYDTRDGTAVRDYIHVLDLADAHVRAMQHLIDGKEGGVFNLGTGTGTTVRELVDTISSVSASKFNVDTIARRPGDSPRLVANNEKARSILGWDPQRTLEDIVRDAWAWHETHEAKIFG